MFTRLLLCLGVCLIAARTAQGQASDLLPVHALRIDHEGRVVRLWLALFRVDTHELRVIDNASAEGVARFANLGAAARAAGAVAGCNASFFERHPFMPVGGMVSEGRVTAKVDPASWMKGLLVMRADGPSLEHTDVFKAEQPGVRALIQSGPWLVREGLAEADNSHGLQAARTFVGHNGQGGWFLGLSDPCSLRELAMFLRGQRVREIVDVRQALNFDGGPSSGLWVKGAEREFYRPEYWDVRNFVVVLPRVSVAPDDPRAAGQAHAEPVR